MNHASLFSGIGGFDLAAEWAGWNNVFHCEWNPFGQKVLNYHFPNSISYNDITKTDFKVHANQIDILTGGFPCQPYSTAGKRLGKNDERHLFPQMLRAIKEIKPRWIIGENVRGLVSWGGGLVFHEVCDDLESEGYEVQTFLIPAASVNAPHQRQRIWFIAYAHDKGSPSRFGQVQSQNGEISKWDNNAEFSDTNIFDATNTNCINNKTRSFREILGQQNWQKTNGYSNVERTNKWTNFPTKPPICGGDDGIPRELDSITFSKWRNESLKAYGNAIVPQVAFEIFKTINIFEEQLKNL